MSKEKEESNLLAKHYITLHYIIGISNATYT